MKYAYINIVYHEITCFAGILVRETICKYTKYCLQMSMASIDLFQKLRCRTTREGGGCIKNKIK